MLNNPYIFLIVLFIIGLFAKNTSLMIAVAVLLVLKLIGIDQKIFDVINAKGINWGVTIITIAVLAPIATGKIDFKHLVETLKSPYAWIAILAGVAVALLAKSGVKLLSMDPEMTVALVFGTIIAVGLFRGVAVGPIIGAGIAYLAMQIVDFFK